LNAADTINGGSGSDLVELNGDYSAGLVMSDTTLRNFETLKLDAGHSYKLTTADATVASGVTFNVDSTALLSGDTLNFNGSAETNGNFIFAPGVETDTIRGGAGNDSIDFGASFTAQDFFNGGGGKDTVSIGASPGALTLSNLKNIETLDLSGGSYNLTTTDGVVASGASLLVELLATTKSQTLTFNGSAETDGTFGIQGGAGNDHLVGGNNNDGLQGSGGADFLRGGPGKDNYFYRQVSDSTSSTYDTIFGFNANQDEIVLLDNDAITGINSPITHGALSKTTFDTDLQTAVAPAHLGAHHAVLFTPDSGTLAGNTFLVIDANGHNGYQAGLDYVIRLASPSNLSHLAVSDFLV
jgi:Ca2+-binding RTX toxin-like protein